MLSDKFYRYQSLFSNYEHTVMQRLEKRLNPEDAKKFDEILQIMSSELMPECEK